VPDLVLLANTFDGELVPNVVAPTVQRSCPNAKTALAWSPTPDAHWAPLFTQEEIEACLAALAARQEPNAS
jgi:hypothetical protein